MVGGREVSLGLFGGDCWGVNERCQPSASYQLSGGGPEDGLAPAATACSNDRNSNRNLGWAFGAPPQSPNNLFWHCAVQTYLPQVSKNTFAGLWGTVVGVFGAPLQNTYNIFGTEQFKHTYPRYPNTLSLAYGVRWYGCLERQPGTQTLFLALRTSNTTVIGMQKHLRWPMVYSGMGVWGATPEPKQIFLALCISTTTVLGIQKHLDWPTGYSGRGVWSATPEPKQYFLPLFFFWRSGVWAVRA